MEVAEVLVGCGFLHRPLTPPPRSTGHDGRPRNQRIITWLLSGLPTDLAKKRVAVAGKGGPQNGGNGREGPTSEVRFNAGL